MERRYWGLSTYITAPTPVDKNASDTKLHSKGLCGNYNGIYDDDFVGGKHVEFAETNRY